MSPRVVSVRTATWSGAGSPSSSLSSSMLMECVVKAHTCSVDSVCTERDQERRMAKYAIAITGSDFTSDPELTTSSTWMLAN